MLIKSNEARARAIGVQIGKASDKNSMKKNAVKIVKLLPGLNELSDEVYEGLKNHKIFQAELEAGVFKVVKEKDSTKKEMDDAAKAGERGQGDKALPAKAKEAIAAVKQCLNLENLNKWLESEERATVRKAIEDQIKHCSLTPEERAAMQAQ